MRVNDPLPDPPGAMSLGTKKKKPAAKKKDEPEEEVIPEPEEEEEYQNAVTQYAENISLSVFDDNNQQKRQFLDKYYSETSEFSYPAQPRIEIAKIDLLRDKVTPQKPTQSEGKTLLENRAVGLNAIKNIGNVGGLHLDEEDAKEFQLQKNVKFFNRR